jgi:hypothetical protein
MNALTLRRNKYEIATLSRVGLLTFSIFETEGRSRT